MPKKIVLSFDADGTVEFTRTNALTLFGGGGVMERVTDIKKQPSGNHFYIQWLMGPHRGEPHRFGISMHYGVDFQMPNSDNVPDNLARATMFFDSYEAAVDHELTVLNAMRKAGVRFGEQAA